VKLPPPHPESDALEPLDSAASASVSSAALADSVGVSSEISAAELIRALDDDDASDLYVGADSADSGLTEMDVGSGFEEDELTATLSLSLQRIFSSDKAGPGAAEFFGAFQPPLMPQSTAAPSFTASTAFASDGFFGGTRSAAGGAVFPASSSLALGRSSVPSSPGVMTLGGSGLPPPPGLSAVPAAPFR
jgi:hypothetical protein